MTKRFVEGQGGRVGVTSRPGQGSTFFAVLPRVPPTVRAPAGAGRILVIDNKHLDRLRLIQFLQSKGWVVETAATSAEALEKCTGKQFDAIALDLVLPDRPGWEVLSQIRSLEPYRHTPVIAISGCEHADVEIPIAVDAFLTKPVRPDDLLGALKRIVRARIEKVPCMTYWW